MFTKAHTQRQNSKDKCKQIQAQMSMENREGLQVTQLQDENAHATDGLGRDGGKRACSIIGAERLEIATACTVAAICLCTASLQIV